MPVRTNPTPRLLTLIFSALLSLPAAMAGAQNKGVLKQGDVAISWASRSGLDVRIHRPRLFAQRPNVRLTGGR